MATTQTINLRAGDTEPLRMELSFVSFAEVTAGDISSVTFFAKAQGADANHVTAEALTVVSVASTDNGDGTRSNTVTVEFDPVDAKVGGGNAFDAPGLYDCHALITQTDGDTVRAPGGANSRDALRVSVSEAYG